MVAADRPGTALIFPGQGSQYVGMGKAWADRSAVARQTFEEADEALGMALTKLCWEGPESELQLTAVTQPAILATSIAIFRAVPELESTATLVAGHSLGEYTAHVAAGTLDFGDALRLVRRRGELMQEAVPVGEGAMAAILGLPAEEVTAVVQEAAAGDVCSVANYNSEQQTVIAGTRAAVERAMELAKERGARRAVPLAVSAPFHCALMASARRGLEPSLTATRFASPRVPVVCNIEARPVIDGDAGRQALMRQVDGPVRWVDSVRWMAAEGRSTTFVEVGPGSVLRGLMRRIVKGVKTVGLSEPDQLEAVLEALAVEPAAEGQGADTSALAGRS